MRPVLFRLGDLIFHSYPTMLAIAFLVGTLLSVRTAERRNPPLAITPFVGIVALVGALAGARIFFILQYESWRELWRIMYLLGPGLVYYGGLFGGLATVWVYLRFNKVPVLPALDIMAPHLALGQAITRVGCFLNGCCYGVPTSGTFAVAYGPYSLAFEEQVRQGLLAPHEAHSLPVHPTQLYMAGGLLVIFALLRWLLSEQHPAGTTGAGYLVLYGALRFTVEIFRGDSARSLAGMTVSQALSVVLVVCGVAWVGAQICRQRKIPPPS
jgi:phosphatidylglycerol:prolipoprotein diacylglycerol transferase